MDDDEDDDDDDDDEIDDHNNDSSNSYNNNLVCWHCHRVEPYKMKYKLKSACLIISTLHYVFWSFSQTCPNWKECVPQINKQTTQFNSIMTLTLKQTVVRVGV